MPHHYQNPQIMNSRILSRIGLLLALLIFLSNWCQAQGKMKVILTGGTDIQDIGQGCQVSLTLMEDAFKYIGLMTNMEIDFTYCKGNDFNKQHIIDVVNSVPNDIYDAIVFFNTSHGFNYQNTPSKHTFFVAHPTAMGSMSQDGLTTYGVSLEKEIYKPLRAKGAPVLLVFSESCNMVVNMEAPAIYKTMNPNISSRMKELFMSSSAHIISSSSQYGQYSYTDDESGGIYANALLHAMNDVTTCADEANWTKVMNLTKKYVNKYAEDLEEGQDPIFDEDDATPIGLEESNQSQKGNGGYIPSGIKLRN